MRETAAAARTDSPPAITAEAVKAAKAEGLRYTTDRDPGFRRTGRGTRFSYVDAKGRKVRDSAALARIRSLVIPPAYKEVWICPHANGHLQATGRDARGRKQYRYHARWRTTRDATKFDRMLEFGRALPRIRRRVALDLKRSGLPREKVLATIVRLLECTLIRVGNEEYARENGSFGLTTLRDRHVEFKGESVSLEFRGKSGVMQKISVSDRAVARILRNCRDIPGQELFQWIDADGERRRVDSNDVNDYLREASGGSFTAKDFRTWFATLEALQLLRAQVAGTEREARKQIVAVVTAVAAKLGNTPTICRKCYIHPMVLTSFSEGRLASLKGAAPPQLLRQLLRPARAKAGLSLSARRRSPTPRVRNGASSRGASLTAVRPPNG